MQKSFILSKKLQMALATYFLGNVPYKASFCRISGKNQWDNYSEEKGGNINESRRHE